MSDELAIPTPETAIIIPEYHWIYPLPNSPEMSAASGYRMTFVTDTTSLMDRRFGLELAKPGEITEEAEYNLRSAILFTPFSAESMKVAEYFTWWAKNFNFFHALPFDEITRATNGGLSRYDLDRAVEEGYLGLEDFPEWNVQVAQLTPKFGSYTLPPSSRDIL